MTVIRGATTIDSDCKKDISAAVKELLDEIFAQNKADKTEIRCIVFSLTTDIHSYHPAKAARECGYDFAPLFACTEPDIRGGLALCVRAMIFAEFSAARPARHVYLKGAKVLRKDISAVYILRWTAPRGAGRVRLQSVLPRSIISYISIREPCTEPVRSTLCARG